jgi:hypothetical protein
MTTLALAVVVLGGTYAQAAVIGVTTLVREPPVTPFSAVAGTNDVSLGAPWVGYTLGVQSDNVAELIGGIDVLINGQLHQRWTPGEDENGDPTNLPTGNSGNATNADSHLRASAGALFGAGPTEDNSGAGSPLANTASAFYGVGSALSGAWGILIPGSTANVAYIVVPKGSEPQLDIRAVIASPTGDIIGQLDESDFGFGGPDNLPPVVGDKEVEYFSVAPSTIVTETLSLTDDDPTGGVWSLDSFASPNGQSASVDPVTGVFSWLGNGTPEGHYNAVLKFTDAGGLMDTGTLGITWHVPEPTSLVLFGLALVGFAGFRRK